MSEKGYKISQNNNLKFTLYDKNKKINLGFYREKFDICDNGGIPFILKIYSNYVVVNVRIQQDYDTDDEDQDKPVEYSHSYYFKNLGYYRNSGLDADWIWNRAAKYKDYDDSPKKNEKYEDGVDRWINYYLGEGNSMLFPTGNENEYIFIGWKIYRFKTKSKVIGFVSVMGNSQVPYPYAYDEDYFYLLIEDVYFKRIFNHNDNDPYEIYYQRKKSNLKLDEKKFDYEIIIDRLL